jgi:hypothetical protein
MKQSILAFLAAAGLALAQQVELPGEGGTTKALGCAPFPDRISAFVWRNWFVVPQTRMAETVKAKPENLAAIAAEMGLPPQPVILPEWRRKGYITVLRRNWHLLPYAQLLTLLDMDRATLRYSLIEDDFLFQKLGSLKPACEPLLYTAPTAEAIAARKHLAEVLKQEGVDPAAPEEPRFAFIKPLSLPGQAPAVQRTNDSPFDLRLIFSYFAEYGDPLGNPEIGSYPEGLLQQLAERGVNAVWLHTVLRTLAKDPAFPEFGEGSERRMENLRKLVARAGKYGIRVFLYMNEPRSMPDSFFAARPERAAMRGVNNAMCTSNPEVRRWMADAVASVFKAAPGLGGIFTITASENLTSCASHGQQKQCPHCKDRSAAEIIAEVNSTLIAGMVRGNPNAEALVWDWGWPDDQVQGILERLPKKNCRFMTVSEWAMPIDRGGVKSSIGEYSLSTVGPGERAKARWRAAHALGLKTAAKVQTSASWEFSAIPYLPVMNLVAEHARNLTEAGADGVMLSWSLGCYPSPNLEIFQKSKRGQTGIDSVLDAVAKEHYGDSAPTARQAWTAFSDGFREYPFCVGTLYDGPQHMGCANPLYPEPTGFRATMVGIPYDDLNSWRGPYPADVWTAQIAKICAGFDRGCALYRTMPGTEARREWGLFRAAELHFASSINQANFVLARDKKDRVAMKAIAAAELANAKAELPLVQADSRIGYECSNHYFFVPQDLREKILCCRAIMDAK